jgi:CDGSH-type Zn-finger protein/uncharacterized Fe-S cluster protein YjdI
VIVSKHVREYAGEEIAVSFDSGRCIHAKECVHGLPGVFDPRGRPWIDPGKGTAEEVAEVVARCPTGALQFRRLDGGAGEPVPERNRVMVAADGPLYVSGDLELRRAGQESGRAETRLALCRCGASKNKPYCDNSHLEAGFADPGHVDSGRSRVEPQTEPGRLVITAARDGALIFKGPVEVCGANDSGRAHMMTVSLCRCGESNRKPFCDATHRESGFEAE